MRKLIAGLLGLVLSVTCAVPSFAQNKTNRYDALGVGQVSYSLNSGGSFYGQLFNSPTASNWSLGFGSSKSTQGTGVLTWNSAGHILMNGVQAPTASSCGTSPSAVTGSDNAGDVTVGSAVTATTSCTITFAVAYASIPHCFANNRTSKISVLAQPTASTLVIANTGSPAATVANTNDVIDYFCVGN